jgi:hypothetical protein
VTRIERLEAARDRLAALLAGEADGSKAASLSREVRALEAELAELKPAEVVAPTKGTVDDIAARREARKSGPSGSGSAAVR